MNTGQKNSKGRTIYRGPRGGEYVLGPSGTKIRKFTRTTGAAPAANFNGFIKTRFVAHTFARHHVYKKTASGRYYAVRVGTNGRPTANPESMMISRRTMVKNERTGVVKSIAEHLKNGPNVATATPPLPVQPARSTAVLMANIMNQIYTGGRGSNINATRYTPTEREKLIRRLGQSIEYFKQQRNLKKHEANTYRAISRGPNIGDGARTGVLRLAAAANERVGYYDDAVRAYTRGLRALKPLTGNIPSSIRRRRRATPNRASPAPASEEFNAIYMPLEKPHLVVKTPGVGVIYLNPNSFRGLIKNAARVNIPEADVRGWLRMARRNFPNEPLFRHPIATSKNVTANQIRFSRA